MGVNKMTGKWKIEKDYNKYPKRKWCNMDYVADWIIKQGYKVKTSYDNLINNIIDNYNEDEWVKDKGYFEIPDTREGKERLMINVVDVTEFVKASGGIEKFDFE